MSTALPKRSPWRVRVFSRYFRRWMAKSFHAVRLSRAGGVPELGGKPLVVVMNHPSWWDPLFGVLLTGLFPDYAHYTPIDAAALRQYRIFEPLGFFGVEVGTAEGARAFLRTGQAILAEGRRGLWITSQGKFVDPRVRPVELRAGVGHLVRRVNDVVVLPLALEYPFWQERAEALARFGRPIVVERGSDHTVDEWMALFTAGLTETSDALAEEAQAGDATLFETLAGGAEGVGGVYDWWRRLKALFGGKAFARGHADAVKGGRA